MLGALPISFYLACQGWLTHQNGAIDCPFRSTYSCVYLVLICVQHYFNPKLYNAITHNLPPKEFISNKKLFQKDKEVKEGQKDYYFH
jgi:hypothetical protein